MDNDKYVLISRAAQPPVGTGCVSGECAPEPLGNGTWNASMSSYSRRLGPYLGQLTDGGTVIDKWNVPDPTFTHLVISGPMVAVGLPEGAVDRCPEIPAYMLEPGGLGGEFKTLAMIKLAKPKWTGLDRISLREYTDLWRDAGARVGRRSGSEIHWEDGEIEQIPQVDNYQIWSPCDLRTK